MDGEGALAVFAKARELDRRGKSVIHLELGEPDFHPSRAVIQAAQQALDAGRDRYCPPAGIPELREAIAQFLQRTRSLSASADNILVTPGCKFALFLSLFATVEEGDEVLHPDPGFPMYASIVRALGGIPVPYHLRPERNFQPDWDEIATTCSERTKIVILNSPSNPTGAVLDDRALLRFAELAAAHHLSVISDEIYAGIVYSGKHVSIATLPGMAERTIVLDGFSKSFAMTGWRLGFVVAPKDVVPSLEMVAVNSFTCAPEFVQWAAIEALSRHTETLGTMVSEFNKRRRQFVAGLGEIPGFRCELPRGAFYAWVEVAETGLSAEELCDLMLREAGVAAIPGPAFGRAGEHFVRFSFVNSISVLADAVERIRRLSCKWKAPALVRPRSTPC